MPHRIPWSGKSLRWIPFVLLPTLAVGCSDDPTEPLARGGPIATTTPLVFAYQLRGDPWIRLLAERSDHGDITLELDRALAAMDPEGAGTSSPASAALLASRQALPPAEKSDLLTVILGLTVDRVTTILDHPQNPYPGIWSDSRTSPSAER